MAIQLRPSDAKAYVGQGNAYRSKGEFDKAIEAYNAADTTEFLILSMSIAIVALLSGIIGEHGLAVHDFSTVIQLQPQFCSSIL